MIHCIIISNITLICFIILPTRRNSWLFPINCSFVGNNFLARSIDMFCCKSGLNGFHAWRCNSIFWSVLHPVRYCLYPCISHVATISHDTICIYLLDPAAKLLQIELSSHSPSLFLTPGAPLTHAPQSQHITLSHASLFSNIVRSTDIRWYR